MSACPSCGHENAEAAKFCSECGTALLATAPAARAERKILTVLFADLVGFTSRAEQLDPEDVQAVLAPYHEVSWCDAVRARGRSAARCVGVERNGFQKIS
jgi:class 3 adenylate cyclase